MSKKPRALDLFSGAGGASYGLHLAGYEVVGVDLAFQKNYPFEFHQADALTFPLDGYDLIWSSPPCQTFTMCGNLWEKEYPNLIEAIRARLKASGKPYIIENVVGAPLLNPLMLCGTMFGLRVVRHRLFETSPQIFFAPASCCHYLKIIKLGLKPDRVKNFASVVGHFSDVEYAQQAMGINWMGQKELAQAIPPAYSEWLGRQLLAQIELKEQAV